jgi:phage-related protein
MSYWDGFNWGTALWTDSSETTAPVIEKLEWIDARGNVTDMSTIMDTQYKEGVDGRFMPAVQHLSEATPGRDGEVYRGSTIITRQLIVPVMYIGNNITDIRIKLRTMAQALNPKRGVGKLRVVTKDGLDRFINCIYEGGMEANVDVGGDGWTQKVAYAFRAFDPYWYNANPVVRPPDGLTTETATFFPSPPFRLGPSTIFTSFTQTNSGDVEAWPIWTISGPGDNIRLVNETTGGEFSFGDYILPDNGLIKVDTRPSKKTVTDGNGNNLWPYLEGSLWELLDGENVISIEMLNSSTDASSIQLTYYERFLGV